VTSVEGGAWSWFKSSIPIYSAPMGLHDMLFV
jgi:hypothetical protein